MSKIFPEIALLVSASSNKDFSSLKSNLAKENIKLSVFFSENDFNKIKHNQGLFLILIDYAFEQFKAEALLNRLQISQLRPFVFYYHPKASTADSLRLNHLGVKEVVNTLNSQILTVKIKYYLARFIREKGFDESIELSSELKKLKSLPDYFDRHNTKNRTHIKGLEEEKKKQDFQGAAPPLAPESKTAYQQFELEEYLKEITQVIEPLKVLRPTRPQLKSIECPEFSQDKSQPLSYYIAKYHDFLKQLSTCLPGTRLLIVSTKEVTSIGTSLAYIIADSHEELMQEKYVRSLFVPQSLVKHNKKEAFMLGLPTPLSWDGEEKISNLKIDGENENSSVFYPLFKEKLDLKIALLLLRKKPFDDIDKEVAQEILFKIQESTELLKYMDFLFRLYRNTLWNRRNERLTCHLDVQITAFQNSKELFSFASKIHDMSSSGIYFSGKLALMYLKENLHLKISFHDYKGLYLEGDFEFRRAQEHNTAHKEMGVAMQILDLDRKSEVFIEHLIHDLSIKAILEK